MQQPSLIIRVFFCIVCLIAAFPSLAQDEIDIVDPYEMKVSRSRQADTFYFTQNAETLAAKQSFDTLRTYDVFLEERITPFGVAYMCNGKEVTKKKYLEYKAFWNASGACKPCLLYTYDSDDHLKHVALQYEDCLCGMYEEYYPEGGKKVEGQFKENNTNSWTNVKGRNLCNKRIGKWVYYLPGGEVEKTEVYNEGTLTETILPTPPENKPSGTKHTPEDGEPDKKGLFHRMKDKNAPAEN